MKCCNNDCAQGRDCPHKTSALRVGDVVAGYIIIDAHPVCWCSITQKWEDA